MKKLIALYISILLTLPAFSLTLGQQADSAYNAENYNLAINLYKESIKQEGRSTDVYYNLGNACYRADKLGAAVINYERALQIDPTNADARENLDFVKSKIQDKPEDDTAFLVSLHRSVTRGMTANTWAWVTFAVFVVLMGAIALYIFSSHVNLRKTGFFAGLVLLFVFLYFLFVTYDATRTATTHNDAVVIVPSTQLTSAPRAAKTSADKVVTIHEGTKVEIIDSVATPDDPVSPMWYNVKINNNTKAWLRSVDVERI